MLAYLPPLLAPLLFAVGFMLRTPHGGTGKHSVSTPTNPATGTRTPATGITVGSSSSGARIERTADGTGLTLIHLDDRQPSPIGRGATMEGAGGNGEQPERAA